MVTTAVGCAFLVRNLGAEFVHDPWNCFVTTLPFGLTLLLVWWMACGWRWALPLGMAAASLVRAGARGIRAPGPAGGRSRRGGAVRAVVAERRRRGRPIRSRTTSVSRDWWRRASSRSVSSRSCGRHRSWTCSCTTRATSATSWTGSVTARARGTRSPRACGPSLGSSASTASGSPARLPPSLGGESPFLYVTPLAVVAGASGGGHGRLVAAGRARPAARRHAGRGARPLGVIAVVRTVGQAFDYRLRWTWMVAVLVIAAAAWAGLREAGDRSPRIEH